MSEPESHSQLNKIPHYNLWVGVFVAVMLTGIGLFYFATQKVEYIWGWYRIPQYFLYKGDISTVAEFDGRIRSIEIKGEKAAITLKGTEESEIFTVPASSVKVEEGDSISEADILASYKRWKAGLLIVGLWITIKLSVIATILGILIGIIGGLFRISDNPALKWLTIVYIELIRGSPLLVQIIIWYYVLGTVINDLLASYGMGRIHTSRADRSLALPWDDLYAVHVAYHPAAGFEKDFTPACGSVYQPDQRLFTPWGNGHFRIAQEHKRSCCSKPDAI